MPYRYRWTSDHAAVIDGHTTPEGTGVLAEPGKEFSTVKPLDHPNAQPVVKESKKAKESTPDPAPATTKET